VKAFFAHAVFTKMKTNKNNNGSLLHQNQPYWVDTFLQKSTLLFQEKRGSTKRQLAFLPTRRRNSAAFAFAIGLRKKPLHARFEHKI
jgi:hypothetical protein